jgi:hypothetical protein
MAIAPPDLIEWVPILLAVKPSFCGQGILQIFGGN